MIREVTLLFLKLGFTAFGGPAAHIAMMEQEIVKKRRWITHQEFLDLMSATNFIPGPNSTEMAIHIGHRVAGWRGFVAAGLCFILPAALMVAAIAHFYVVVGTLPVVQKIFYGINPVIIAVVAQAILSLSRTAVKSKLLAAIGIAGLLASLFGTNELLVIALSGVAAWAIVRKASGVNSFGIFNFISGDFVSAATANLGWFSLFKLFFYFLKIGSVLFGSGYVLFAFLHGDLVEHWHWLTESQLLDAIAVGQITPGPVFTTATFIGYLLGGAKGATLATLGIFLPAFVFVAMSAPIVSRIRSSQTAKLILDGVNVGSLAVMTATSLVLAKGVLIDWPSIGIALISAIALIKFEVNSIWLVLIAGVFRYFH